MYENMVDPEKFILNLDSFIHTHDSNNNVPDNRIKRKALNVHLVNLFFWAIPKEVRVTLFFCEHYMIRLVTGAEFHKLTCWSYSELFRRSSIRTFSFCNFVLKVGVGAAVELITAQLHTTGIPISKHKNGSLSANYYQMISS